MDLRGYAGSDHTPHGYDPTTLSEDVAGVIRCLGEESATIIGHGWGGLIAWSMPVLTPDVVRAIVPVSMPHPRRLRRALLKDGLQRGRSMYAIGFQWPFLPERSLMAHECTRVAELITEWSATPGFPDAHTARVYRSAFSLWPTAHCAVEYHRWAFRSFIRSDGLAYARRMDASIDVPVLHLHGAQDSSVLPRTSEGSADWVNGNYEFATIPDVGHFPHEEDPGAFADVLMPWLDKHRADQPTAG
jgi:pimeloyl-ACP methyl ester carboxylesterase